MLFHSEPLFSIYWGDKKTAFPRHSFSGVLQDSEYPFFKLSCQLMGTHTIVALKQVHGTSGTILTNRKDIQFLAVNPIEGDYLISALSGVGVAVKTGDCLPVIVYDPVAHVVGIAHAGWAGSVKRVAAVMIEALLNRFSTRLDVLRVFLGPSAKACCYVVNEDLAHALKPFPYAKDVLYERQNRLFFDLPLFNILQLEECGIARSAIHTSYNVCTICDVSFCSHRREGQDALRQISIVALK